MDLLNVLRKQWDRVAAIVLTIVGVIFLISGWVGVSGTAVLSEQTPYIVSGAVGGIFLLVIGATLWVSADLRDEWRKLDRIEQALAGGVFRYDASSAADRGPASVNNGTATAKAAPRSPERAHA